jgi:hypothetical protein
LQKGNGIPQKDIGQRQHGGKNTRELQEPVL